MSFQHVLIKTIQRPNTANFLGVDFNSVFIMKHSVCFNYFYDLQLFHHSIGVSLDLHHYVQSFPVEQSIEHKQNKANKEIKQEMKQPLGQIFWLSQIISKFEKLLIQQYCTHLHVLPFHINLSQSTRQQFNWEWKSMLSLTLHHKKDLGFVDNSTYINYSGYENYVYYYYYV